MLFILQMAWRDSKASRRRLLGFSLCIAFGIAALVALDSFGVSLGRAIQDESKSLLGADLVVTSRSAIPPAVRASLVREGGEISEETSFSSMMVFPTAGGQTRLVQVRAETGSFPFYGARITDPSDAAARLRAGQASGERIVVLEDTLLDQFHLRPGDRVRLGRADFRVAGALKQEAGESLVVTLLAPRALVPQSALAGTGLDENGPLVRHSLAARLPAERDADAIVRDLRERFASARLSFDTVASRRRELGRTLTDVDGFLSLVGFVALLLGAIGVASAVHVHVRQKMSTVAILRCLGTSSGQAFAIYLVSGGALGLFGAVAGAALGIGIQALLPAILHGLVPLPFRFAVSGWAVARGMGAGVAICLLFTLLPLLGVRRVPPLAALRSGFGTPSRPDPALIGVGAAITLAVAGFAIWQTRSAPIGLGFTGVLGLGLLLFAGIARTLAAATRRWTPRRLPYVVRQGVANLHRPQNRTVLLLVALGLGTFLFLTLWFTRTSLLRELRATGAGDRPNLMFFDIQEDQIGPFDRLLDANGAPVRQQAPIVAMKIAAVNGQAVENLLGDRRNRAAGWALRREYRSTYREQLGDTERVTAGTFTGRVPAGTPVVPISVDVGLARDLGVGLGDRIDWDVQGVTIPSRIGSIRTVDWKRLEPNFFVVFPAGVLEDAPKFYVAAVRTSGPAASGRLQAAAVREFPNVSAIDLGMILDTLDGIFRKISFVVEFMAWFIGATALGVLASAVFAGRHQRRREIVLLRALGASRRQIVRIQAVEYAILGLGAAAVGSLLAWPAGALLARFVFHLTPAAPPLAFVLATAAVTGLTLLIGWLSDRDLARHPPLEALRAEG